VNRFIENLKVRFDNWRNRPVARAYRTMAKALQNDPGYAKSWQANFAVTIYDGARGRLNLAEADEIADDLMRFMWGVTKR